MVAKDGRVKVMDFGLAKLRGSHGLTKAGQAVGTIACASHEQLQGVEVDSRTDPWSLGVTLFEMVTGRQPFQGDHEAAIVYSVMHLDAPNFLLVEKKLPPGLIQLPGSLLQFVKRGSLQACRGRHMDQVNRTS